jgi:multisubunit Na+/H+ antiporter MnhC subunit
MKTKNSPTTETAEVIEVVEETTSVEPTTSTVSTPKVSGEWAIEHSPSHHYSDMAKITAGLLVGVLALMTFLLSVGLQHPKPMIRNFLYVSFVALGVSLIFYQIGTFFEARAMAKGSKPSTRRQLGVVRVLQHVVFATAIVATIGFALSASQLFFVTAQTQTQAQPTTAQ